MKTITLICKQCGENFDKLFKEVNRQKKKGRTHFFCSQGCATTFNNLKNPRAGNTDYLISGNRQDEFSSFRYYVNKARCSQHKELYGESDISVEYLKELWDFQKGICPYTSIKMELPRNTIDSNIKGTPNKASLDRIDSSKGYIRGNVEFVCLAVNYAKNGFSKEQIKNFFDSIQKSAAID